MKEIGAIFVASISEIRTVQLAAIMRRYSYDYSVSNHACLSILIEEKYKLLLLCCITFNRCRAVVN